MSRFVTILPLVLKHEGGFVDHPLDPGGATNKGITQKTYDVHRIGRGKKPQSVRLIELAEVADIYRSMFWEPIRGDELPIGWDYAIFDFGVNIGPARAVRYAQLTLKLRDDGVVGPKTIAALKAATKENLDAYIDKRREFLCSLPTFVTFGKGWLRRVEDVRAYCHKLIPDV